MSSAAGIAGSRTGTFSAAGVSIVNCGAGYGAQARGIRLCSRLVVRKVGLLVCNARAADKAVGSLGATGHCLARSLSGD
jgi:hypothetical protein